MTSEKTLTLIQQLDISRFERALGSTNQLALGRGLLTTAECERLNQTLTGKKTDPWRSAPVEIVLPSGKRETLQMLKDPKLALREALHRCTESAESGRPVDAALDIYESIVLLHPFIDANRRTAALGAHYFFNRFGVGISGLALHELGLGDLRDPNQKKLLRETVAQMVRFVSGRDT